jgi:hypothetical protein
VVADGGAAGTREFEGCAVSSSVMSNYVVRPAQVVADRLGGMDRRPICTPSLVIVAGMCGGLTCARHQVQMKDQPIGDRQLSRGGSRGAGDRQHADGVKALNVVLVVVVQVAAHEINALMPRDGVDSDR